jgi:hypothetical protein
VKAIDQHTVVDYAHVLKELSDTHFPAAQKVVFVQDNLNIHKLASLYEAFPAAKARRLVESFEWHCTPNTAADRIWRNPNSACCQPSIFSAQSLAKAGDVILAAADGYRGAAVTGDNLLVMLAMLG